MTPPFIREFPFAYGRPDRLSETTSRVIANNPGPFTFTGSGTYLIGNHAGITAIDPGPDDAEHIEAIVAAADGPITHILVTHTHMDHCAGAQRLKARTGARIYGAAPHGLPPETPPVALEEGDDFSFSPDQILEDGAIITLPAGSIRTLHTPGHTANHLCFLFEEDGALFSGDHIMGWSTTVIAPPDGDMRAYLTSLERILKEPVECIYPTHGAPIENPTSFVEALIEHRRNRDAQILAALQASPQTTRQIAQKIYTDIDRSLLPAASLNVLAHLQTHVAEDRVTETKNGLFSLNSAPADSPEDR